MVEKISSATGMSVTEINAPSDKKDLLDLISKKKKEKKPAELNDMAAIMMRHMPQWLEKSTLHDGGMQSTETTVSVKPERTKGQLLRDQNGGQLLLTHDRVKTRSNILAVATLPQRMPKTADIKVSNRLKISETKLIADSKAVESHKSVDPKKTATLTEAVGGMFPQHSVTDSQNVNAGMGIFNSKEPLARESNRADKDAFVVGDQNVADVVSDQNVADVVSGQNGAESVILHRIDSNAHAVRTTDTPHHSETSVRSEKKQTYSVSQTPVTNATTGNKSVDLNYQFQRWSGDHSVKVSIPAEAKRDSKVTLHPSDSRAAEVLSREMATIPGQSAKLLQPGSFQSMNMTDVRREGHPSLHLADVRTIDGSSRMAAQSPEPAAELVHARQESEERQRRQQQRDTQDEEQE